MRLPITIDAARWLPMRSGPQGSARATRPIGRQEQTMVDIRHRIGIAATPESVYEAFATIGGLTDWWTREVEGDAAPGGTLRFYFGTPEPSAVMQVVEAAPARRVEWRCVGGPDEWVGTRVTFDLHGGEDETVVLFAQAGWRDPGEF